ncbi:hypothetical protein B9Z19DRAFT_1136244 [Tuber borchii]|uniref:Uncharacterized protein n=1 Tax=Tuber borchii TaxID=42251 RepID=A0A2T6ZBU8_TUBBO|nr:hypothetical protein B9Z19DRAFT_1136244 [Tuber borchii]
MGLRYAATFLLQESTSSLRYIQSFLRVDQSEKTHPILFAMAISNKFQKKPPSPPTNQLEGRSYPIDERTILPSSRTDTYYVNKDIVLRTHTSASQAVTIRLGTSDRFLISSDVYSRDLIDRSSGCGRGGREGKARGGMAAVIKDSEEVESIPKHWINFEDLNLSFHEKRNPLQVEHPPKQAGVVART